MWLGQEVPSPKCWYHVDTKMKLVSKVTLNTFHRSAAIKPGSALPAGPYFFNSQTKLMHIINVVRAQDRPLHISVRMWTPSLLYYPLLICKWMRLCVDRMQAPQEPCINVDARCLIGSCLHLRLSFSVESYLWMRISRMDVTSGWRLRSWSSHVTWSRTNRSAEYDR